MVLLGNPHGRSASLADVVAKEPDGGEPLPGPRLVRSFQGPEILGVHFLRARATPTLFEGQLTVGPPPGRCRLVWSGGRPVVVRAGREALTLQDQLVMWLQPRDHVSVAADSSVWIADFVAQSCPTLWSRSGTFIADGLLLNTLRHLHRSPRAAWAPALASAAVDQLAEMFVTTGASVSLPVDDRVRPIAEAVLADPASSWELADWAHRVGAGERTLRRLFRTETGLAFGQWRTKVRVRHAMRLLESGSSVSDAGARSGFASASSFFRAFRRETGWSPTAFLARETPSDWPEAPEPWPPQTDAFHQDDLTRCVGQILQEDSMMITRRAPMLLLCAALLTAAACGSDDDAETTSDANTTIDDSNGETTESTIDASSSTVTEAEQPEANADATSTDAPVLSPDTRIIAADEQAAALLIDLGISPVAVGGQTAGAYGEDLPLEGRIHPLLAEDLPDVQVFGGRPLESIESIAQIDADVVLGFDPYFEQVVPEWNELAEQFDLVTFERDLADHRVALRNLAALLGLEDRAEEAIARFDERIANAPQPDFDIDSIDVFEIRPDAQTRVHVAGTALTLLESRGVDVPLIDEVEPDQDSTRATFSNELAPELLDSAAVMIYSPSRETSAEILQLLGDDPLLQTLPAVEDGNVFATDVDALFFGMAGLDGIATAFEDLLEELAAT